MINLLFGYVTNIDTNGRAAVKLPELDNWVTDFLPVIKRKSKNDKENDTFDMDEEVAVLFDDKKQQGVILGAINTDSSALKISDRNKVYRIFSDGTHLEYDKTTNKATANIKGTIDIKTNQTTHKGDLIVEGNILCTGNVSDMKGTMQAMREIYNSHSNPNYGADVPTPQM